MKSLVLAEKPSVARDIARVLGCHKNISGAIEGSNYIVTWALGHLVTLADPEEYDKKFTRVRHLPLSSYLSLSVCKYASVVWVWYMSILGSLPSRLTIGGSVDMTSIFISALCGAGMLWGWAGAVD